MLHSFFFLLFALRAISENDAQMYQCPSPSANNVCQEKYTGMYTFETDCATSVSLEMPALTLLTLTYTCYNSTTHELTDSETTVFYEREPDSVDATISLNETEDVYCTFTGCGRAAFPDKCYFVLQDLHTCSWFTTTIHEEMSSTLVDVTTTSSLLLSTSKTLLSPSTHLLATTLSQGVPSSSSTGNDLADGGTDVLTLLVVVLVVVFVMIVVVIVTFFGLIWRVSRHSGNKGNSSFTTVAYVPGGSGISLLGIIQEDEISLAPSVTTIYATVDFNVYSNCAIVMEDDTDLPGVERDKVPLRTDLEETLPSYKASSDHDSKWKAEASSDHDSKWKAEASSSHDSKWKADSMATVPTRDDRFSIQVVPQGQTANGAEKTVTSCHEEHASLGTRKFVPIRSASPGYQSTDLGYTSNDIFSSSNDGYIISSDESEYEEGRVSLSPSASDDKPALLTTVPRLTASLSEQSLGTELTEDRERIEQGTTLASLHGDGCSRTDRPVTMPASDVDSGYNQVDLFLCPEVSLSQPSLTVDVLGETGSLDEAEVLWEDSVEEAAPKPLSGSTEDKLTPLLSGEQSIDGRVSLDSSGYLKDDLQVPVPRSHEEDLDEGHLFLDEQPRDRLTSPGSSGYWKDNLTSIPSREPKSEAEHQGPAHVPVNALDCLELDASLQTPVDLVTEYDFGRACHADFECSKQDGSGYRCAAMEPQQDKNDGYIHSRQYADVYVPNRLTAVQSGQDDDDYIHSTMQSGKDRDGYIHSTMQSGRDGDGYMHSTMQSGQDSDGYIHSTMQPTWI